jgi:IS5 family transposase
MNKSPAKIQNPSKAGHFMQLKNMSAQEAQGDLFRSRLDQILNNGHPLFKLARQIDWSFFDTEFSQLFVEMAGCPGLPTRLIVGLHYLKHTILYVPTKQMPKAEALLYETRPTNIRMILIT